MVLRLITILTWCFRLVAHFPIFTWDVTENISQLYAFNYENFSEFLILIIFFPSLPSRQMCRKMENTNENTKSELQSGTSRGVDGGKS